VPPPWLSAAQSHAPPPAAAFLAAALPRLGWRLPQGTIRLRALSVRHATRAQLAHVTSRRQQRHADFVACVHAAGGTLAPADAEERAAKVGRLLRHLWRVPWDNAHKEVLWRLALNALPTAARRHATDPCCCGTPAPDAMHHFWACPVAETLRTVLAAHLQRRGLLPCPLQAQHVLLALPPSPRLHAGAWRVVCLAAVCALDHARRAACARVLDGMVTVPAGPEEVARMADRAIVRFWDLLTDFCVTDVAPAAWQTRVQANHPFIAWAGSWHTVRALS